ncbi:MAG: transcriptional repressor [Anaerolineae bacterium]|jgi:Fur family peroxide stress response transcriptional regulator|nr:transcriptional repressor [Anaerolineae bacterium]
MVDSELRFNELLEKLRARQCRITPQRMALLRMITSSEEHPTAMELYERLREQYPTTSLATVYKTINLLKEMGEVIELSFSGDDHRYDGNEPFPHPHLVCVRCHSIIDPEVPGFEALAENIVANSGYKIISHRLDFFGICPKCQAEELD